MLEQSSNNQIEKVLTTTLTKLKAISDTSTVIGNPQVVGDGVTLVPIMRLTMGMLAGGGEYETQTKVKNDLPPFAGGSGAVVAMNPIGFLLTQKDGDCEFININGANNVDKIINMACSFIDRMSKNDKDKQ